MKKKEKGVSLSFDERKRAIRKYIGNNIVGILALLSMCVIFVFISVMDFADMSIDWSKIHDKKFWTNYVLLMALGLLMFSISTVGNKSKRKNSEKITGLIETLYILKNYIIENCLYPDFIEYLEEENRKCKLFHYQEKYRICAMFVPFRKKKEELLRKANNATLENIDELQTKYKEPYSAELIFNGVPSKRNKESKIQYSGREGLSGALVPSLLWSLFFQLILLSAIFSPKKANLNTWIQLLAKVWIMLSFAVKGASFGNHSIDNTYYGVLENRKGMILDFLAKKGINIVIKDNENYKYKVVEINGAEVSSNEGVNNGQ